MINSNYDDCYFSDTDGYYESDYVFIEGNDLALSLSDDLKIGETGFGSGLNLLVLEDFLSRTSRTNIKLHFTTVEKYPLEIKDVDELLRNLEGVTTSSLDRHLKMYKVLCYNFDSGWNSFSFKRGWGELIINIFIGDISQSFKEYPVQNDVWFLDGHSPDKNPEMWSENTFRKVAENSTVGATFATFTAAGIVKRGLREAGFFVKRKKGYGRKRHMISGYLEKE